MNEESVFAAAIAIPSPAERAAYLDRACAGEPVLRRQVDDLLAGHVASNPLDRPPADLGRTGAYEPGPDEPAPAAVGDRVGPYRLMEQIGEGGFGLVFVAEQTEPVRRRVALEVLKPGMDTRDVIARFEAERQALALMDHPNIAKVFDAGSTLQGRPYFVMELVRGLPITDYCDQNKIPPKARLELFVLVCQAVQHAHQKGIIHRDLKPSNVLVTVIDGSPVPKVIDFGVAKAVGQSLTEKTVYTRFAQMIGTPLYMSPEQAALSGVDVDTRSDVYALGVLLYELLTGTTPFDRDRFRTAAYDEIRRIIREEEPPKPSTRLSQMRNSERGMRNEKLIPQSEFHNPNLRELDWIVMRALEKDRNRRYDAANSLAKDVQRYLAGDAVEACPPTLGYRLRKTYRRNRPAVLVGGAFAAVLLAGVGVSAWLAAQARDAERVAIGERDEKEKARNAEADQRMAAVDAQQQAQRERDAAKTSREQLRRNLYSASMSLISIAWKADHVGRAIELLDEQRPKADEVDLRGFEWHHWDKQLHSERRELVLDQYRFPFQLSEDGRRGVFMQSAPAGKNPPDTGRVVDVVDLVTGKVLKSLPVPRDVTRIGRLAINRDGSRVVLNCYKEDVSSGANIVWNVEDGKVLFNKESSFSLGPGRMMAISPDGKRLAMLGGGRILAPSEKRIAGFAFSIWNIDDSAREPITFRIEDSHDEIADLKFSPDGKRLAFVSESRFPSTVTIRVWDEVAGKCSKPIEVVSRTFALAFNPDGTKLAGVSNWSNVKTHLWNIEEGGELKPLRETPLDRTEGVPILNLSGVGLTYSPNGRQLAFSSVQSPNIWLVEAGTGKTLEVRKSAGAVRAAAAFTADGSGILSLSNRETASTTGLVLKEWDVPSDPRSDAGTSPDLTPAKGISTTVRSGERQAVYRPVEGELILHDKAGKELRRLQVPKYEPRDGFGGGNSTLLPAWHVSLSPNGHFILVKPPGGQHVVFDTDTGKQRWIASEEIKPQLVGTIRVGGNPGPKYMSAMLSPDSRLLALPEADGVRVVRFDDFQDLARFPTKMNHFAFSPDNRKLVTASQRFTNLDRDANRVELWDLGSKQKLQSEPLDLFGLIGDVVFSPDSRVFATSPQGTTTVWNADTGAVISRLRVGPNIGNAAINTDGTALVVWQNLPISGVGTLPAVWDTVRGKLLFRLEGLTGTVMDITYSPDGKRIATATTSGNRNRTATDSLGDTEIKLWDASTGRELLSRTEPGVRITKLWFSPDGHRLTLRDFNSNKTTWDATPRPERGK